MGNKILEERGSLENSSIVITNPLSTFKKVSQFNHSTATKVKTVGGESLETVSPETKVAHRYLNNDSGTNFTVGGSNTNMRFV